MTELIKNLITDFAALNFGWGAWLLFIFATVGGVVVISKLVKLVKAAFAKWQKKKAKKQKKEAKK